MLHGTFSSLINEVAKLLLEANRRSQKVVLWDVLGSEWHVFWAGWSECKEGFSVLSVKLDNQKTTDHTHVLPMMTSERNIPIHFVITAECALRELEWKSLLLTQVWFYERSQPDCTCEHTVGHAMVNPFIHFSLNCSGKPVFYQLQKIWFTDYY